MLAACTRLLAKVGEYIWWRYDDVNEELLGSGKVLPRWREEYVCGSCQEAQEYDLARH